nr:MAG TPA: hypothetical protein [Caudoviricetes sp.]
MTPCGCVGRKDLFICKRSGSSLKGIWVRNPLRTAL